MADADELLTRLLAGLEERGAPDAIVIADLMRLEQHLVDSLRIVRRLVDATVRREASDI